MVSQGLSQYFEDVANYFDLWQCGLLFVALLLPVFQSVTELSANLSDVFRAFSVLFCWVCMLFKLMAFDRLQKLVRIIIQIIDDP
eukprot:SAG11_NODE_38185_length_253_cov_1.006494_1_plen_84_part_11